MFWIKICIRKIKLKIFIVICTFVICQNFDANVYKFWNVYKIWIKICIRKIKIKITEICTFRFVKILIQIFMFWIKICIRKIKLKIFIVICTFVICQNFDTNVYKIWIKICIRKILRKNYRNLYLSYFSKFWYKCCFE